MNGRAFLAALPMIPVALKAAAFESVPLVTAPAHCSELDLFVQQHEGIMAEIVRRVAMTNPYTNLLDREPIIHIPA